MAKARSDSVPVSIDTVIYSLRIQGIAFRGPFHTESKGTVFVVGNSILLESELVELLAQDKLNRDGIKELAKHIEAPNSSQ